MKKATLTFTKDSPKELYQKLYSLNVGNIFKIESDYETVMQRIEDYKPEGMVFEVFPINPGTDLYTIYGCDHLIITNKKVVNG